MRIDSFSGRYRFLSNFYRCRIVFDGIEYQSTEHAFQAAKTLNRNERQRIANISTAVEAKKAGRKVKLRADWESEKINVMLFLLRLKFAHGDMREALLQTGDDELVEGNTWGDTFWGVCNGVGENMLGKLLMQVREELRSGKS